LNRQGSFAARINANAVGGGDRDTENGAPMLEGNEPLI